MRRQALVGRYNFLALHTLGLLGIQCDLAHIPAVVEDDGFRFIYAK